MALAVRHGHALALARVDIDHFKRINDAHGHAAGDVVLAEVARRLGEAVRGGDRVARWGGDEFVAILPDTDRDGALRAAERLRAAVADAPVEVEGALRRGHGVRRLGALVRRHAGRPARARRPLRLPGQGRRPRHGPPRAVGAQRSPARPSASSSSVADAVTNVAPSASAASRVRATVGALA